MKAGADSWTLLTHGEGPGYVQNLCWSRDGSKLYFDRYWGGPVGVYTIPRLGGEPVLLLEGAWDPQALPDGSLVVRGFQSKGEAPTKARRSRSIRSKSFLWRTAE